MAAGEAVRVPLADLAAGHSDPRGPRSPDPAHAG